MGIKEFPPGSNSVDCNTWYYGKRVHGSQYPWCCVEMQYVFYQADASKLLLRTASCSTLLNWFKNQGRLYTKPEVGDLVFYKFNTTAAYKADHVGIVDAVNKDGSIYAIEGNTSQKSDDNGGSVMRRLRKGSIVGYGRPAYEEKPKPTAKRATLKLGDKGPDVVFLKQRLIAKGFGNLEEQNDKYTDGVKNAVMYIQALNGLKIDGICGPITWQYI